MVLSRHYHQDGVVADAADGDDVHNIDGILQKNYHTAVVNI